MRKRRAKGEGSITRRKDGTWVASVDLGFKPNGKRHRLFVYARTQAAVLVKLSDLRKQAAAGIDLTQRPKVSEYLNRWLDVKANTVKPRTLELYRGFAAKAADHLGRHDVAKLSPLHVQAAVDSIRASSGASTANKVRRMLFGAFKQAVEWRLLPYNPVEAVKPVAEAPREVELWTPEHAAAFLDAAMPHRLYALFYLLLSSGLRQGEALALRWTDVAADHVKVRRTITRVAGKVEFSTPKTRRGERVVTLPPDTIAVLEAHKRRQDGERVTAGELYNSGGLVFCNEIGGVISPMALHHVWRRLLTRAGVPRIRLHDLRHLHVSLLVQRGVDPRTIADRIGHTDAAFTLRRYSHMFELHRRVAAVSLSDLLGARGPVN